MGSKPLWASGLGIGPHAPAAGGEALVPCPLSLVRKALRPKRRTRSVVTMQRNAAPGQVGLRSGTAGPRRTGVRGARKAGPGRLPVAGSVISRLGSSDSAGRKDAAGTFPAPQRRAEQPGR